MRAEVINQLNNSLSSSENLDKISNIKVNVKIQKSNQIF